MDNLKGKKAVVTGGAMGFGLATCEQLIKEGIEVAIWDLNQEALDKAIKDLQKLGGKVRGYHCDVSDKDRVFELAKQAINDMGQVDILVNNAGFTRAGFFTDLPLEQTMRVMDVNINAIIYATYALLPHMIARNSGYIINVGSLGSWSCSPNMVGYYTSKYAVLGFTDALRIDLKAHKKDGVHIASVHPSIAATGMFESMERPKGLASFFINIRHDDVGRYIVKKAIKKKKAVVTVPGRMYLTRIMAACFPTLMEKFTLSNPQGMSVMNYKGRPGMAHTDPSADKKPQGF
jgi:short-subunit dehydrogenase